MAEYVALRHKERLRRRSKWEDKTKNFLLKLTYLNFCVATYMLGPPLPPPPTPHARFPQFL